MAGLQPARFTHSDISGSLLVCKSPELFAAYHVFLRLQEPRHPPYALSYFLSCLTYLYHHLATAAATGKTYLISLIMSMNVVEFAFDPGGG